MDTSTNAPQTVHKLHTASNTASRSFITDAEERAYLAIRYLHRQMDDDLSGNIDLNESDEFIREELNNVDGEKRQHNFHQNDYQISVQELWVSFKKSVVYYWTVDDVVLWLEEHVDLPDYVPIFRERGITGLHLPQLAANQDHFFTKTMGRFPADAKKKIILKATDAVIFGPPASSSFNTFKDAVLLVTIVVASICAWLADIKSKESRRNISAMTDKMESLVKTESDLRELQEQLKGEEQLYSELELSREKDAKDTESLKEKLQRVEDEADKLKMQRLNCEGKATRLKLAEEELERVCTALKHAEEELSIYEAESTSAYHAIPEDLRLLLTTTYLKEVGAYRWGKAAAEKRLLDAKEFCGKMKKKRDSVFNVMSSTNEGLMDSVDERIADARQALEELGSNLRERRQRWQRIEVLCGVSLRMEGASPVVNLDVIDERESSPVFTRSSSFSSIQRPSSLATSSAGKRRSVASSDGAERSVSPTSSRNSTPVTFHLSSDLNSSFCDLSSPSKALSVAASSSRRSSDATFPRSSTMPRARGFEAFDRDRVQGRESFLRTSSETHLRSAVRDDSSVSSESGKEETIATSMPGRGDGAVRRKSTASSENYSKPFSDDSEAKSPEAPPSPIAAQKGNSTQQSSKKQKAKKLLSRFLSKEKLNDDGKDKSPKLQRSN